MNNLFLDDPRISGVVFYPRKITIPTDLGPDVSVLKFQMDEKILIGGFFFHNDPELPTILLFHGNGEIALDYQYFAPQFFECGVNLAVLDFRGYGFSTGDPIFSGLIKDALPSYKHFHKWMQDKGLKDSLFVLGRSLGSTCAAEIGAQNPAGLRGIIFESAIGNTYRLITDLFRVSGPDITAESLKEWSNDTKAARIQRPVLIIHGTRDGIVPSEQAQILFDAIPEEIEKRKVMIEGAGHNDIFMYKDEYFTPLRKFIEKYK